MEKPGRNREKGDAGRCSKQRSKNKYTKKRRNANKGKKLPPRIVAADDIVATPRTEPDDVPPTSPADANLSNLELNSSVNKVIDIEPGVEVQYFPFILLPPAWLAKVSMVKLRTRIMNPSMV